MNGRASNRPPLSPKEAWLSDGRQVLHFRPSRCDRWSQQLEVTVGELLPGQPVPLPKHRGELSREAAIKPWLKSAMRAGLLVVLSGELCRHEAFPADLLPNPG